MRLLILLFTLFFSVSSAFAASLAEQRKAFVQAMNAIKKGKESYFLSQEKQLRSYILYPFLRHAYMSRHLVTLTQADVDKFLKTYPDSQLAQQLHYQWLHVLAQRENWTALIKEYRSPQSPADPENVTLQCLYRTALLETGNTTEGLRNVKKLWLTGRSQPKACDAVFTAWRKKGGLTPALIQARIQLASIAGERGLTSQLLSLLPKAQQGQARLWTRLADFQQLAKKNPDVALKSLKTIPFTPLQKGIAARALALSLAQQGDNRAVSWLEQVPPTVVDQQVREWRIRMALMQNQWSQVSKFIAALPKKEQQEPVWRYWSARALQALGQTDQAKQIYESLVNKPHYYGFLSNERLKRPFVYRPPAEKVSAAAITAMENRAGLKRAYELYQINWASVARREWDASIRNLNISQLRAAGQVALKWAWPDRAIATGAKTGLSDDITLRFPLAFRARVITESERQDIDPSWIFAVMRQESAFMPDAKSHVGAMGLMQLMPATARWLAKKAAETLRHPGEALQIHKNIRLGSHYLQELLEQYDGNIILATTAYNAGPGRVKKWLALRPALTADQWIESIPFHETRNYVKNVLAYTSIYDVHFGEAPDMAICTQRIS